MPGIEAINVDQPDETPALPERIVYQQVEGWGVSKQGAVQFNQGCEAEARGVINMVSSRKSQPWLPVSHLGRLYKIGT